MLGSVYKYKCELIRVVDGDTVWVRVDLGFRLYHDIDVRLGGINAPERDTEEGKAAKAALIKYFEDNAGKTLIIETEKADPGSYNRYTGILTLGIDNVNDWLVKSGHAVPYVYKWG